MKRTFYPGLKGFINPFLLALAFVIITNNMSAQVNQYHFFNVDTAEEYKSTYYARTANYYWDQGFVDRSGNIYFVFVDNYKLYCYKSEDNGENWTEEQIITGYEGKVYMAMMGLTQDDKRVIVFSTNSAFNNGTVPQWNEFYYDAYAAVEGDEGWTISTIKLHTSNHGLLPYGIITTKSGLVHVILNKSGWYNYGGELYEVIYDPASVSWGNVETIKIFGDRNVDNSTNYVGKTCEAEENEIVLMYQRHGTVSKKINLEIMMKTADGWQNPHVLLENNSYSTYNRFDLDYDRHGHFYAGYFEPWGANGPEIYMAHNSINDFTKYELFSPTDTLIKMNIHPFPDAEAYIYCNFKHSYPKILKFSEAGLELTDYLPDFEQEDSVDVMRFHYSIPRKNNFAESLDSYAFTNRWQGREGDYILEYPIVFVRKNLERDVTGIKTIDPVKNQNLWVYPNPCNDYFELKANQTNYPETIEIYNALGSLVKVVKVQPSQRVDISDFSGGIYIVKDPIGGGALRLVKD